MRRVIGLGVVLAAPLAASEGEPAPPGPPPPVQAPPPEQQAPVEQQVGSASASLTGTGSMIVSSDSGVSVEPAFPLHIEYGLDFGFGAVSGAVPMNGFAGAFSMPLNVFVTPWLALGARGHLTISADPAVDDASMSPPRADAVETPNYEAWSAAGGPRIRIYDPDQPHGSFSHRMGWLVDIDLGWVAIDEVTAPAGPLGRLVVGRQILMVNHQGNGVNLGMAFGVESGFGSASAHRAAFFTTWFHGEGGAPVASMVEPPPDEDVWWPASFIFDTLPFLGTNLGDVETTGVVGMAIGYGVAASELVEPLVRADVLSLRPPDGDSDSTTMLGASAGLRFRFNEWGPWQAEVLGGYEKAYGIRPAQIGSGPFVDLGTGFHIVHCRYGIDVGTRLRLGVGDDNRKLATLAFVLGFVKGNIEGAPGRPKKSCADLDR